MSYPSIGVSPADSEEMAEFAQFKAFKAMQAQQAQADVNPLAGVVPTPVLNPQHNEDSAVEKGELQTAIRSVQTDENGIANISSADLNKLMARLEKLESEAQNKVVQVSQEYASGGEPVLHHLVLDDGTVIKDFPGIATHIETEDGIMHRILHAFVSPTK